MVSLTHVHGVVEALVEAGVVTPGLAIGLRLLLVAWIASLSLRRLAIQSG